ncbi:uncharacterized protein Tco025E_02103 [Trypanosoma conorhini]|uniref:Uncharacterized protein n=1 Tax=Trypanosoma conorhini TaxID=83891 RepID=A0A3R7PV24_9TRYP|nr:uncharacterized protein Tco025E_02103 [Trypanosoma conorhini]RNF25607.1 hypothetical protein Tco025E_02103 [Trypanosoma conorhini]
MSFLLAIVRITGFVLFFLALLRVKKTRLRHLPSRRTRVSRHHGETCVWMERLANAVLDLFYAALREEGKAAGATEQQGRQPAAANALFRGEASGAYSGDGSGVKGAPRRLLETLEERLEAMLEDRGIAANAACRVHSIGHRPPSVRAIRVTNLTEMEYNTSIPAAAAAAAGVASAAASNPPLAAAISGKAGATGAANTAGAAAGGVSSQAPQKGKRRPSLLGTHASGAEEKGEIWGADSYEETLNGSIAGFPASVVELEAEVEYAGGADVSLQADICLARGRLLPVSIRVNEVKFIKAHVRVCAKLQYERATMDSRRKPYLQCTLWLESEPAFSLKMSTLFTRYRIQNFFAVPLIVKFLLLRFVRHRMMRPNGAGVTVNVPLPENIVDGGTQMWCAPVNDAATAVSSANGRGPSRGVA